MSSPNDSLYSYNDARLLMHPAERFFVRLVSYVTLGVGVVGGLVAWGSTVPLLHGAGALVLLFMIHLAIVSRRADRSLYHLSSRDANIARYLAPETYRLIEQAFDRAALRGGDFELHLLQLLLRQAAIRQVFVRLDVTPTEVEARVARYLNESANHVDRAVLVRQTTRVVELAFAQAVRSASREVLPHDLLGALGRESGDQIGRVWTLFDITPADIETAFIFGKGRQRGLGAFVHHALTQKHRVMNRAWTARPTPTLDQFSIDVTDAVRAGGGGLLVGHATEYNRLRNVLSRPGKPNALLIGDPGAGSGSLMYHLALEIIKDRVPGTLFDHRIVSLSLSALAAGASDAAIQERLTRVVQEVVSAGNVILALPDIHLLLKTSGSGRLSGADILIPAIQSGAFSVVGSTTPQEYKQSIERDGEFAASFEAITVSEISEEEAVRYLVYAALVLEQQSGATITFKALKEAVRIAHKYLRQRLLPSSAEDLLKEALAGVLLRQEKVLSAAAVVATAEQKVNIKIHAADAGEVRQLLHLEDTIHQQFIDQEEAVHAVASALREYRAGVTRSGGPIASFLFCGPTGVGKTELAKILAATQFGDTKALLRFDMSEYQDKQSFYRLIGSPDGTMRGSLTEAVLERPYCLLLLDEFEKAYPDILTLFLQVLDDGRLTDNFGRVVDFQNVIIIATSNAHSTFIQEELLKNTTINVIATMLKKRLTEYFKPELINRFSQVVVFKPLSPDDITAVARLNLGDLSRAVLAAQAITLTFDETAIRRISELGYDPIFGARPLRQAINDHIRSILADKLLKQEFARGSSVRVVYAGNGFVFEQGVQGE